MNSTVMSLAVMSSSSGDLLAVRFEATVGTLAALSLAAVLAIAAVAKLRHPDDTAREFAQLRLPLPHRLATVVPAVELVAAATLLMRPMVGALVAGLLLVSFTLVLVEVLQNREPDSEPVSCACFGSLSRRPVSTTTVARNIGLLSLAGLSALTPSLIAPDLASVIVVSMLALVIAVAGQLVWVWSRLGSVWSVELAGELGGDTTFSGDTKQTSVLEDQQ